MSGHRRTTRTYEPVQRHRAGVNGSTLLGYREVRDQIYLPDYR